LYFRSFFVCKAIPLQRNNSCSEDQVSHGLIMELVTQEARETIPLQQASSDDERVKITLRKALHDAVEQLEENLSSFRRSETASVLDRDDNISIDSELRHLHWFSQSIREELAEFEDSWEHSQIEHSPVVNENTKGFVDLESSSSATQLTESSTHCEEDDECTLSGLPKFVILSSPESEQSESHSLCVNINTLCPAERALCQGKLPVPNQAITKLVARAASTNHTISGKHLPLVRNTQDDYYFRSLKIHHEKYGVALLASAHFSGTLLLMSDLLDRSRQP
jgi:hypothetical protein